MGTELEEHPGHRDPVPWQAQSGRDRGDAATRVHAHQVRVRSQEYAGLNCSWGIGMELNGRVASRDRSLFARRSMTSANRLNTLVSLELWQVLAKCFQLLFELSSGLPVSYLF